MFRIGSKKIRSTDLNENNPIGMVETCMWLIFGMFTMFL